jgi:formate dehydrogenase subunit delta
MDVDKLVKMANQIAANLDYGPDKEKVVTATAEHLKRYWTPAMRALVIDGQSKKVLELSPLAARAVEKLAGAPNSQTGAA